jgi:hypothetical protein
MNFFEWIGFFISALSVLFLVGKAMYDAIQREKNPSKFRAQQEEAERRFKAFLRGESPSPTVDRVLREVIEEDEEEEELEETRGRIPLKKPEPKPKENLKKPLKPEYVAQQFQNVEALAPAIVAKDPNSFAKNLLFSEGSKKQMVILSEVFGTPKGLR